MSRWRAESLRVLPKGARRAVAAIAILLWLVVYGPSLLYGTIGVAAAAEAWVFRACDEYCHQLAGRSFFVGETQQPLCVRCTGLLSGLLFGIALELLFAARSRVLLGAFVGLVATAASYVEHLVELDTGVSHPWLRFTLGFVIYYALAVAISVDVLALLSRGSLFLVRRLRKGRGTIPARPSG